MHLETIVSRINAATRALTWVVLSGGAFAADEIHWTITGPTSVTFDWRGSALENTISYGLSAASYSSTVTAVNPTGTCVPWSSSGPFWEARLTGLLPDTLYHYSIANGADHTFRTPPPSGASGFVVLAEGDIGDSLSYDEMLPIQQLMAQELDARFALLAGDLTYGEHGPTHIDQHFNDVMVWSRDVAYMPTWGNHEYETPSADDLRNYKGRFDFANPRTSPGTPPVSNCGEDWYWFDYGNARFIAYPEPWSGAEPNWRTQAGLVMDAAQSDPNIRFIVTFGHRPGYSSGHHSGEPDLKGYLDALASSHPKYVLNLNGHSHNYERTYPQDGSGDNQHGAVHVTVGTGGGGLEQDGSCLWLICTKPSWSAARYMRLGYLRLNFMQASIQGSFICGPAGSGTNDISCSPGSVIDSFTIGGAIGCGDNDGDGYGNPGSPDCPNGAAADCNDANVLCTTDCTDTDGDGACDPLDDCTDSDGDGFGNPGSPSNICPQDCAPSDASSYPGAPEVNDGRDNQCPGYDGHGLIDETGGISGFHSPTNPKTDYSWPLQTYASLWEIAKAETPDFAVGCSAALTSVTPWTDVQVPAEGALFFYLNHPVAPFVGSWGAASSGVERIVVCSGLPLTTLDVRVAASLDDAEETATGSMRLNSSDLELVYDGSNQTVGLRFNGLAIPQGARISSAYVQFKVDEASSEPTALRIEGESADDPLAFASARWNISSRPRTSAFVSWNPPSWLSEGAAGPDQRTPDLSAIVQEIVSRPGWVGSNSLVIVITGTGRRVAEAWDRNLPNTTGAPLLHVEFVGGGRTKKTYE